MCIGVFTLEHPEYALILCTNRDEFLDRPTQDAHFHAFGNEVHPDNAGPILSGRDLQAGGSWFGINRSGRVALLTNITEPMQKYNTSRGYLVSSFLQSDSPRPLEDEIGKIVPKNAKFAGFNLLLLAPALDPEGLIHYSSLFVTNHGGGGPFASRPLTARESACGCISNGVDGAGAASWPKVERATQDFATTVPPAATEAALIAQLFDLLAWHPTAAIAQRSELRNTVQVTPVPIAIEGSPRTAPAFYGTRLASVLLVRKSGEALFIERDIWVLGDGGLPVKAEPPIERVFRFQLDVKPSTNANADASEVEVAEQGKGK